MIGSKNIRHGLFNAALLLALFSSAQALAQATSPAPNAVAAEPSSTAMATSALPEFAREISGVRMLGAAKLNVWGFDIYNATLWTQAGFEPRQYMQHSFALELSYLRSLEGKAIVKRSLDEMKRLGKITPERAQAWQAAMADIFPNVKAGDRITGVHRAGSGAGALFWVNGQVKGEIKDPEFARLFFGIWLSESTSEPALRRALLGQRPA